MRSPFPSWLLWCPTRALPRQLAPRVLKSGYYAWAALDLDVVANIFNISSIHCKVFEKNPFGGTTVS